MIDDAIYKGSGLTPAVFWENPQVLLEADEDKLSDIIRSLAQPSEVSYGPNDITLIKPTAAVYVGSLVSAGVYGNDYEVIVNCSTKPLEVKSKACQVIEFPVPDGKKGAKALRTELRGIIDLLGNKVGRRVLFTCPSGDEIAPVVALVILCLYYDDEGKGDHPHVTFVFLGRKLLILAT